ncbi:hypothetical protein C0J52_19907 [Blattella germanica]|nr:hypothetical protein C0J52_19907 [Blattella germanica]
MRSPIELLTYQEDGEKLAFNFMFVFEEGKILSINLSRDSTQGEGKSILFEEDIKKQKIDLPSRTLSASVCHPNSVAVDRIASKSMPVSPPSVSGLPTLLGFTIWTQMDILCITLLMMVTDWVGWSAVFAKRKWKVVCIHILNFLYRNDQDGIARQTCRRSCLENKNQAKYIVKIPARGFQSFINTMSLNERCISFQEQDTRTKPIFRESLRTWSRETKYWTGMCFSCGPPPVRAVGINECAEEDGLVDRELQADPAAEFNDPPGQHSKRLYNYLNFKSNEEEMKDKKKNKKKIAWIKMYTTISTQIVRHFQLYKLQLGVFEFESENSITSSEGHGGPPLMSNQLNAASKTTRQGHYVYTHSFTLKQAITAEKIKQYFKLTNFITLEKQSKIRDYVTGNRISTFCCQNKTTLLSLPTAHIRSSIRTEVFFMGPVNLASFELKIEWAEAKNRVVPSRRKMLGCLAARVSQNQHTVNGHLEETNAKLQVSNRLNRIEHAKCMPQKPPCLKERVSFISLPVPRLQCSFHLRISFNILLSSKVLLSLVYVENQLISPFPLPEQGWEKQQHDNSVYSNVLDTQFQN